MDKTSLKRIIGSEYQRENFLEIISSLFSGNTLFSNFHNILSETQKEVKEINEALQIGEIEINGEYFGFFEFQVNDSVQIARNRVGLHRHLQKQSGNRFLDGALAVYFNPNQKEWRLSFLRFYFTDFGKQSPSNAKRFTYIFGENIPNRTAIEQIAPFFDSKFQNIDQIENAFSVEKVSEEFFDEYKLLHDELIEKLKLN